MKITIHAEDAAYQIIGALKLNRAKRRKLGEVFVEGTECIRQADRAGCRFTRIISAGGLLSRWAEDLIARHPEALIVEMTEALFRSLCDKENPAELLATVAVSFAPVEALVLPERPFIVLCDRPGDLGNLGSIIRSANAFGVDAVLINGHAADVWEPKVIRASVGAVFHTPLGYVESMEALEQFIAGQKNKNGMVVVGTDSSGAEDLGSAVLSPPVLVLIGNEAKGISVALKELCDTIVKIPIGGEVNSLNVACAASIVLYDIAGRR